MELDRLLARALHCHVDGIRSRGRQQKKWINSLKEYFQKDTAERWKSSKSNNRQRHGIIL